MGRLTAALKGNIRRVMVKKEREQARAARQRQTSWPLHTRTAGWTGSAPAPPPRAPRPGDAVTPMWKVIKAALWGKYH